MDTQTKNKKRRTVVSRDIIHIISRNSNWSKTGINETLAANVYADKKSWYRFIDFFLLALGVGFAVSGVIFFFAYNWDDMPPFVKMGIVCALLVGCVAIAVYTKIPQTAKNIIITGAALLVGVLLAVYGQIYQTGANNWEMFAEWTAFIVVWAVVVNFAPLWLLFMTLLNTSILLYKTDFDVDFQLILLILFLINALFVVIWETLYSRTLIKQRPGWLLVIISLFAALCSTIVIITGIVTKNTGFISFIFINTIIITILMYILGIVYSLNKHYTPYLLIIAASGIAILTTLLAKFFDEFILNMFLCGFFVIGSVTITTKYINNLNKKWYEHK